MADLDEAARQGQRDALLPPALREAVTENRRYAAIPIGVHRTWLWLNDRLLKRPGAHAPADWPGFFVAAEAL